LAAKSTPAIAGRRVLSPSAALGASAVTDPLPEIEGVGSVELLELARSPRSPAWLKLFVLVVRVIGLYPLIGEATG
jgi:hypothetical protein